MGFSWDLTIVVGALIILLTVIAILFGWRGDDVEEGDDPVGDFIKKAADKFGGSK